MPEEEFETIEFKEKLEEATEHAVEAAEHRSRWLVYLSFTTALIAVLAAVAALESGTYSNEALIQKNEALLAQAKASDQWAYYQAKGIKGSVYATQAAAARATNPELGHKPQSFLRPGSIRADQRCGGMSISGDRPRGLHSHGARL